MHQPETCGCRVSRAGSLNVRTTRQVIMYASGADEVHGTWNIHHGAGDGYHISPLVAV